MTDDREACLLGAFHILNQLLLGEIFQYRFQLNIRWAAVPHDVVLVLPKTRKR